MHIFSFDICILIFMQNRECSNNLQIIQYVWTNRPKRTMSPASSPGKKYHQIELIFNRTIVFVWVEVNVTVDWCNIMISVELQVKSIRLTLCDKQECIPVGCVPPAAVTVEGEGVSASVHAGIPPPRCGPGDPPRLGYHMQCMLGYHPPVNRTKHNLAPTSLRAVITCH